MFDGSLDQLEAAHITAFTSRQVAVGIAPKTINNRVAVLAKLMRFARKSNIIKVMPDFTMLKFERPEIRLLRNREAVAMIEAAGEMRGFPWEGMIRFALNTGLRIGELRALHWEDVNLVRRQVRVCRNLYRDQEITPKSKQGFRTIDLNDGAMAGLKAVKAVGIYVFGRAPRGEAYSCWACNDAIKKIAEEAKVENVGWHTLRHTFASNLVMAGVPIRVVQYLMGHATTDMTMRYSHLTRDSNLSAVTLLDASFNEQK